MKTFAIVALLASVQAVQLRWPSVARCAEGQVSKDGNACDHNNNGVHPLDGTRVQLDARWPSVARCAPGQVSKDGNACDHNNNGEHPLDGTTAIQLEYRPAVKCKDPKFGNPISCDEDDLSAAVLEPLSKVKGLTPVKVVVGGPSVDNVAAAKAAEAKKAKAAAADEGKK